MNGIATKLQTGTAACAIAVAATLTPAVVAQAEPAAPIPLNSIGGAGGSTVCGLVGSRDCSANRVTSSPFFSAPTTNNASTTSAGPSVAASPGTLAQNPLLPTIEWSFSFQPLALVPAFLLPYFSWFLNLNFESCIGGLTFKIGPYGTVSSSYSSGGCV